MSLEQIILKNLIYNEEYTRKVLPFIKSEYFLSIDDRTIFDVIVAFINKYNTIPTTEVLNLAIQESKLGEQAVKNCLTIISSLIPEDSNLQWLLDNTEEFCQDKAVYNAVLESIHILDGKSKTFEKGAIPKILSEALAVGFDTNIGHDYLDDSSSRYDFYHLKENHIPFDLEYLNLITKGGLLPKTLNILLAGTGVGKTLVMCHMAAGFMVQGKNVLYITMEMAEERIAERIDANLLNVDLDDLTSLTKEMYEKRVARIRQKSPGKLIIKEYPTAAASTTHFRALLNELRLKKNFEPDIIFVDYLNICCSSRIKMGSNVNSYTYIKSIAEELRGVGVEYNVPVISATQTNRSGFTNSDPGLEDTSESFGLPATADLMIGLITSEALEDSGQLMFKQLKNRYSDLNKNKRFVVGIDKPKMRLYDVEQRAQDDITDSGQDEKRGNKYKNNF